MLADIEDLFNKGGCKEIDKKYHNYRIIKFMFKELTPEQKIIWKRYLGWRWKKEHPEFTKSQNKYYYKLYRKTKPHVCICKKCGQEFNAAKKCYKICPRCQFMPSESQIKKQEILERKIKKMAKIEQVYNIYITGEMNQTQIARVYDTTQENISRWIRKYKKYLQNKKK